MTSLVRLLPLTLILLMSVARSAEPLQDPTRPPAGWAVGQTGLPGGEQAANTSGLQTIVLPKLGKPWAVINGERVLLGGKVGEARVVKITESEVVLKGADGLQTLKMIPSAEKVLVARKMKKSKAAQQKE